MGFRRAAIAGIVTGAALVAPMMAGAHPERPVQFPDGTGSFPKYRAPSDLANAKVVCKSDSRQRIRQLRGWHRKRNLKLLRRCRFEHIQAAVNAAKSGDRNLILPGVYREEPSRAFPNPD